MKLVLRVPGGREFGIYPVTEAIPEGVVTESSVCDFFLRDERLDIFRFELDVDGDRLDRIAVSPSEVRWVWKIGFHAGYVEIRVHGIRPRPLDIELVTDPSRSKLTRSQFHQMVGDILEDSLALIGVAGSRFGIASGNVPAPDIARFEFLRQCIHDVSRAVQAINKNPLVQLHRTFEERPLSRAGRVTPLDLSKSVRNARKLSDAEFSLLSDVGKQLASRMRRCLPTGVAVAQASSIRHRREHADILAAIHMWRGFLSTVVRSLERLSSDPLDASIDKVRHRCEEMLTTLSGLCGLDLFDGIVPTRGALKPTQVFRRARHYREFYRAYLRFFSGLARITGDFLKTPIRRTFDLYEMWCFLRLVRAAATMPGADRDFSAAFEDSRDRTGLAVTLKTKPFRVGALQLIFKPPYSEVWKTNGPDVGSFSRAMEPDIAIEGQVDETGRIVPAVIFDAKYRVEEQINDAITSIHTYRDALVERTGDNLFRRTVRAAMVIVPYLPYDGSGEWRQLDAPNVFFREEYQFMFRFGAVVMRPGVNIQECRHLLESFISHIALPRGEGA